MDPKPLNSALKRKRYQIPVVDDLLPDLTDACVFTKVDLASVFWHLELDEESSMLTTFAMPYGRYHWLWLPFGLSFSSEIFHRHLHQELQGVPGVKCIADDVLIHGTNEAVHDSNLEWFMGRCQQKGIKLNSQKLELKGKEVPFHGHLLTTASKARSWESEGDRREAVSWGTRWYTPAQWNGQLTTGKSFSS